MDADLSVLTPDDLGPAAGNAARVAAVASIVEPRSDAVPHLLLPVRLETRFVRREVPVADLPGPGGLIAALDRLTLALRRVARADVETAIVGTVPQKRKAKAAAYGTLEKLLDEALATLADAEELARQPLAGDAAAEKALAASLEAALAELPRAQASIGRLRSEFQRRRFEAVLVELGARLERLAEAIRLEVLPGSRLLREAPAAGGRRRARRRSTAARLTASARAATAMRGRIEDAARRASTRSSPGPPRGPAEVEAALARAGARGGSAGRADRCPCPAAWRDELAGDAGAVAERLRLLAAARRRREAASRLAELAAALDAAGGRHPRRRPPRRLGAAAGHQGRRRAAGSGSTPTTSHVDTHEEALTAEERDAGFAFWRETLAAGSDEVLMRGGLAGARAPSSAPAARRGSPTSPRRAARDARRRGRGAAIIAALTTLAQAHRRGRPLDARARVPRPAAGGRRARARHVEGDPSCRSAAIERIASCWRAPRPSCAAGDRDPGRRPGPTSSTAARSGCCGASRAPSASSQRRASGSRRPPRRRSRSSRTCPLRDATWTRAARSRALPDRFLVVAVSGGRPSHVVAGAAGAGRPAARPRSAPRTTPSPSGSAWTSRATSMVGASIRWMVDFDEALRVGHGGADPDHAGARRGAASTASTSSACSAAPPPTGRRGSEELLDNHHYGHSGLAAGPGRHADQQHRGRGRRLPRRRRPGRELRPRARRALARSPTSAATAAAPGAPRSASTPERLAHVAGADGRDVAEALAMSRRPLAGDHGLRAGGDARPAVLARLARPAEGLRARERRRARAAARVPRRPPALRRAATTAHSRFVPAADERSRPSARRRRRGPQARFDRLLRRRAATDGPRLGARCAVRRRPRPQRRGQGRRSALPRHARPGGDLGRAGLPLRAQRRPAAACRADGDAAARRPARRGARWCRSGPSRCWSASSPRPGRLRAGPAAPLLDGGVVRRDVRGRRPAARRTRAPTRCAADPDAAAPDRHGGRGRRDLESRRSSPRRPRR